MNRICLRRLAELLHATLLLLCWQVFGPSAFAGQEYWADSPESPSVEMGPSSSWQHVASEISQLRQRVAELESRSPSEASIPDQQYFPAVATLDGDMWHTPRRPRYNSPQQYPTIDIHGFIQMDSAWFRESEVARMITGDIADTTAIRRARVALSGHIREKVSYKLDVDFAGSSSPSFRDVFIGFEEIPWIQNVHVGLFKAPFEMDAMTSSKHFTLAERAPQFTFAPFRQLGIGTNGTNGAETRTWALSAYRFPTDGRGTAQADNGYGISTRTTILPWPRDDKCTLLHFGGAYSFINPGGDVICYEVQSPFFVPDDLSENSPVPPLLDTGLIPTSDINLLDVELAGTLGAFHYQSELTYSLVNQIGGPPLVFYGAYGQIGWFLTGETRPYNRELGAFSAVSPVQDFTLHGGPGAWEIATRWSYTDLNDENITGGRLNTLECALNWYWSRRLKVKLVYARALVADPTVGDAALDIFGGRFQAVY